MDGKGMKNLVVENLSVRYDKLILDRVNIDVKNGEFVAIAGKSGCGKTTLLNAIAGFVDFEGKIIKPQKIGMVLQNFAVFPWLTAAENIRFGIGENGKTMDHYLNMIGLQNKGGRYPFQLSGGETQRVALARTLASDPDLILMDEPYGSLDVYTRSRMQQWLLNIWEKEKKTILFVTHSIEEAIILADRVLLMKDGRMEEEFPIGLKRPRSKEVKFNEEFTSLEKDITRSLRD